jgi:hypothetical protein
MDPFVVLEIGSGSFKLHQEGKFSLRFESSLGKGLKKGKISKESFLIAQKSLQEKIIPFLKEHDINPKDVLVFATSAVRQAMKDPSGSGEKFLELLAYFGFKNIKVFSEDEECEYAAWAVSSAIGDLHDKFQMLDTGGASHQLVEIENQRIIKKKSIPIGSHTNLDALNLPNFLDLGFTGQLPIAVIGTTGYILNNVFNLNRNTVREMIVTMQKQSVEERRSFLKLLIAEESVYDLFVDYRLAIFPNSLKIIYNCIDSLKSNRFLYSESQAMNYISKNGFIPFKANN